MRKYFTQEEREAYNAQKNAEANQRIDELARTWQRNPEDVAEFIRFQEKFHTYSARNKMLIYRQNPNASYVASMADFNRMGYWIRRGEHGMSISVYMPIVKFRTKPSAPWRSIKSASEQERAMIKAGMLETHEEPRFGIGSVYDISQTTCPLSDYPKLLGLGYNDTQHAAIYNEVKRYCENIGIEVKEQDLKSVTLRGYHDGYAHRVVVNDRLGDTQKLSTLVHEMSHELIGHNPESPKTSAQKEFEADALSMMFEQQYGIPTTDARKSHLAVCYTEYCAELQEAQKAIEIDKIFEPVNDAFKRHVKNLEQQLQGAGIMQKPQDILIYSVRTIEQNKAVITEGFTSLDAAVGHIRQMAENSDSALRANAGVESWKILSDQTQFEISAAGKTVANYEYSQSTGLHIANSAQESGLERTPASHENDFQMLDRLHSDAEMSSNSGVPTAASNSPISTTEIIEEDYEEDFEIEMS